jgi:hypothetical protein
MCTTKTASCVVAFFCFLVLFLNSLHFYAEMLFVVQQQPIKKMATKRKEEEQEGQESKNKKQRVEDGVGLMEEQADICRAKNKQIRLWASFLSDLTALGQLYLEKQEQNDFTLCPIVYPEVCQFLMEDLEPFQAQQDDDDYKDAYPELQHYITKASEKSLQLLGELTVFMDECAEKNKNQDALLGT